MLISHAREVTFRGCLASLFVLRNDGYCWGRIKTRTGQSFDIDAPDGIDPYDDPDEDALDTFAACLDNPAAISPAINPF